MVCILSFEFGGTMPESNASQIGDGNGTAVFADAAPSLRGILRRLPPIDGKRVRVEWRPALRAHRGKLHSGPGPGREVHAATFPRQRLMVLNDELLEDSSECARIFTHEVFHFVWLKLGNTRRHSWEAQLIDEWLRRARGELGWSSEWRKQQLKETDLQNRTRLWREYACESFCDTAAWLWSGLKEHDEYTLAKRWRTARREWFRGHLEEPFRI